MSVWVRGYLLEHGQLLISDYTTEENVSCLRIHYLQLAPQLRMELHEPLSHPWWKFVRPHLIQVTTAAMN